VLDLKVIEFMPEFKENYHMYSRDKPSYHVYRMDYFTTPYSSWLWMYFRTRRFYVQHNGVLGSCWPGRHCTHVLCSLGFYL
jgi:hypothetical protein